jgi:hypothetical protein
MTTPNDHVAVVTIDERDEPLGEGVFGAAVPVNPKLFSPKNYAEMEQFAQGLSNDLMPLLQWVRQDRQTLEEEWRAIRRMEMLTHDEGQRYKGRSNAYLPVYTRALQTQLSQLSRGLFPSDEYLDVVAGDISNPEAGKPLKSYIQWEFESVANLKHHMRLALRPYLNYGLMIMKHWYSKEKKTMGKRVKEADLLSARFDNKNYCEGFRVSARNPFHWYVYPTTINSLDEARLIFEDMDVSVDYARKMGHEGRWHNVELAINGGSAVNEADVNELEQLSFTGQTRPSEAPGKHGRRQSIRVTEVWTFMALPDKDAYVENELPGSEVPVKIVLAGDVVLSVTRNPFFHQRAPYEAARMNAEPGQFYGYGAGRVVRYLQYLSNDFANQTNDVGVYGLNPIVKVNPSYLTGPLKPIAPGVQWLMTDVKEGVAFERPPVEIVQYGQTLMQSFIGMAQDFGGAPPVLQGLGGGSKGAKTATGQQILQRNATTPLQDEVENIETDVMIPLMRAAWYNAQQFREADVLARVDGGLQKIPLEALFVEDPDFRWLASNQAANQQQRAQAGMQLIQMVAPLVPLLQQQGKQVNFSPLLKRVFSDGLGFRGFAEFITDMPMGPGMMPGAPMDPGMMDPNAQSMPPGDRPRSTLEQVEGQPVDAVPGEAEDFAAVRSEADDIAAFLGGQGGDF